MPIIKSRKVLELFPNLKVRIVRTDALVHLTCSYGSVLLWRRCNTLCTSGFVDDVMFSDNGPRGSVTLTQQPSCNIVHCARANTPAAWCWLRSVLDDDERQYSMSPQCKGWRV